jgi:hypothetical protein
MAEFFKWASETPAANLLLVVLIGAVVLTIGAAVILSIIAFFGRIPFEFFGFRVWTSPRLVCDTGMFHFPDNHPPNFHDGTWEGTRSLSLLVEFSETFVAPPRVLISIIKFDVGDGIARLEVNAENVAKKGFLLRFRTWENGRLYGASVSWIAIGY